MADELRIKINEMGAAQTILGTEFVPIDNGVDTLKATLDQIKEHAIGDNNISALGDGSVTGAILAVKSASESADENIVSTMTKNGAHNLLQNNGTSQVINDVTFTVNADKSVTVSSSNNQSNAYFWVAKNFILPSGNYKVRGSKSGAMIYIGHESTDTWSEVGIDTDFSITSDGSTPWSVFIYVPDGTSGTRTTYPMIRLASDPSTAYEPYAMTNRELTAEVVNVTKNYSVSVPSSASNIKDAALAVYNAVSQYLKYNGMSVMVNLEWAGADYMPCMVTRLAGTYCKMSIFNQSHIYLITLTNGAVDSAYDYNGTVIN